LTFDAVAARPAGDAMKLKPVRIGLWDQYGGSMPSGWTRWLFEQYEFPFDAVFPGTLDAGNLNAKYDVLIFVDGGIPERDGGGRGGFGAQPAAETIPAEFRGWLGRVTVSKTVPELKKFAENGGTVLTIGSSSVLGHHLGLPIRDALVERVAGGAERPLPREKYYIPGSILEARIDNTQPLAYGMNEHAMVFYDESPAFRLQPEAAMKGVRPIAWYDSPTPLRSGWAWGQQYLDQAVSIVDAQVGKGHVVLFGNEVNWRGQPHGTFKLLFNGIYYGNGPRPHREAPGRPISHKPHCAPMGRVCVSARAAFLLHRGFRGFRQLEQHVPCGTLLAARDRMASPTVSVERLWAMDDGTLCLLVERDEAPRFEICVVRDDDVLRQNRLYARGSAQMLAETWRSNLSRVTAAGRARARE
jgi:hypothetical protein